MTNGVYQCSVLIILEVKKRVSLERLPQCFQFPLSPLIN